jgi:hypothetical protein
MHNVIIQHNLDPGKFIWLWAKYVSGINEQRAAGLNTGSSWLKTSRPRVPYLWNRSPGVLKDEGHIG